MGETGNEIEQDIEEPVGTNLQSGNWTEQLSSSFSNYSKFYLLSASSTAENQGTATASKLAQYKQLKY